MSINDLREQLNQIDEQIVELIANRQDVVGRIGEAKQSDGKATRDFEREKDVLDAARQHADGLGVDPNLAEEILTSLIRASLAHQEKNRVVAEAAGDGRRALVIGGAGKMGGWFANYFGSQGFLTIIADPGIEPGPGRCRDWRQAGIDYDVIVVATPMAVSGEILAALAELRPEGLVFDVGSLKSPLRDGLAALREAGCRVASLHPMFGPDTELLSGRHMIFVDAGSAPATADAKALFAATMVEQLDMSLEDHDRLIAYVLGLSHALNIAFFTALAESGEAAPRLAKLSSTTFDAQLLVSGAVAHDNPHMYYEIQNLNDYGMDPLDALCEASARIRDVVKSGDEDGFVDLMLRGREYLAQAGLVMRKFALGVVLTLLQACSEAPAPDAAPPVVKEPAETIVSGIARIFDGRPIHDTGAIVAAYRAESGVRVEFAPDDGENADVLIYGSYADLWTNAEADKFRPVYSAVVEQAIPEIFSESESRWVTLSYQARAIVYNGNLVSDDELASVNDYTALADARWQDRVCLSSSSVGGNRLLIAYLISVVGKRDAELAVRGWRANFAEPPFDDDETLLRAIAEGRCAIGIAGVGLLRADRNQANVSALFFADGQLVDISAAAVSRHASSPDDALAFVEWLVGSDAMSLVALQSFEIPVAVNTRVAAAVQADADKLVNLMNLSQLSFLIEEADLLIERARYP